MTTRRRAGVGIARLAARIERRRRCRARFSTSIPIADRQGRTDRIRRIATAASTPSPAARPARVGGGVRWCSHGPAPSAASGSASSPTWRDYDLSFREPVRRLGRQHPPLARAASRPMCRANAGIRILRRRRVARRDAAAARSSPPADMARCRSSAACSASSARRRWNAGDRATFTAGIRGERITRDAAARRSARVPAAAGVPRGDDQLGEPQGRRVVPRQRRRTARCALHALRHRHPPARCVRDRLHRQLGPEAGTQQQRRVRR